jgi:hypothetical protein
MADEMADEKLGGMSENRIQRLVEAGVAENAGAFSTQAKKVIGGLSDEEFNCILTIRRQVIAVVSQEDKDHFDHCWSFIT